MRDPGWQTLPRRVMGNAGQGATLRETGTFTRVAVTAVRCPGCGKVQVSAGSTVLKTIDLSGNQTRPVTWVSKVRAVATGPVTLTVVSRRKPVVIDAFGMAR